MSILKNCSKRLANDHTCDAKVHLDSLMIARSKAHFSSALLSSAAIMLASSSVPSFAEDNKADNWDLVGNINITFGGDELVELMVEDFFGDEDNEEVKAGELISFAGGAAFQIPQTSIQLQGTVGYHVDGIFADNGDVEFSRFPVELMAFYRFNKHRFGLGVTEHLNPKLELDLDYGVNTETEYDDAFGLIAQYDYRVTTFFAVGVRFVDIEYEAENSGVFHFDNSKVDGSHIGVSGTFFW